MKVAIVALLVLALVLLSSCETPIEVIKQDADSYIVCDQGGEGGCAGANPEKGIRQACLAQGRSIVAIRETKVPGDQGIEVTCGEKLP